jgi:hypothetical protein
MAVSAMCCVGRCAEGVDESVPRAPQVPVFGVRKSRRHDMNDELKVLDEGISEEEVMLVASEAAEADDILERIEVRAECCVDHLCDCSR